MALSSRYQHELSPGGLDAVRLQTDRVDLVIVQWLQAGEERRWSLTVEMQR